LVLYFQPCGKFIKGVMGVITGGLVTPPLGDELLEQAAINIHAAQAAIFIILRISFVLLLVIKITR
jgi:hypothetical protein